MMELQAGSGVQEEQSILPAANKKYKDTIFRMLFSDKKNLLSLYNALNGKNYSFVENGLNILIYDQDTKQVIDHAGTDIYVSFEMIREDAAE